MRIDYRAAVPVSLIVGRERREVSTAAQNVGALLAHEGIQLGTGDQVQPAADEELHAGTVVRVSHETTWMVHTNQHIVPGVVNRYDPALPPGVTRTVAGSPVLH